MGWHCVGKVHFNSREEALAYLDTIPVNPVKMKAYPCEILEGKWHVGHIKVQSRRPGRRKT